MSDRDPSLDHDHPAAWAQAVLRRQVERLDALAEIGLEFARAIQGQGGENPAEAAMAFSRVARTVRMCGLLQSRLIKDLEQVQHRAEEEQLRAAKRALAAYDQAGGEDVDPALMEPAERHKYRVTRIVARIAEAKHRDDEEACERLVMEAAERLDDDDIYDDVLSRPIGELVALICRDLDLEPDWQRLSQEAWARAEIASGTEGSPFVAMQDRARPPPLAGEVATPRCPAPPPGPPWAPP
jgi:hypothetical protein